MATRSTTVTVTTTPARIVQLSDQDNPGYRDVAVQNTGATTAYLGGPTVDAATGFPLAAGAGITLDDVQPSALPFAVVASGTTTLAVLEVGV